MSTPPNATPPAMPAPQEPPARPAPSFPLVGMLPAGGIYGDPPHPIHECPECWALVRFEGILHHAATHG
jgi:hypothetical protein